MKERKLIAVLGAGHGGQAMAAHLALQGHKVNLYNRSEDKLAPIRMQGGIYLTGAENGFARLNLVTTEIEEAINGAEWIMVVLPSTGHEFIARKCAHHLEDGQTVVLNPGRTCGALEVTKIFREMGVRAHVTVVEAQTFLYASRVVSPGMVRIFGVKEKVFCAAIPGYNTLETIQRLREIFPQFVPATSVLETSFNNMGAIFHPAPMILNTGRIETVGHDFEYYHHGCTPSVAKILAAIDQERLQVGEKLGLKLLSAREWLEVAYGTKGDSLFEAIRNTQAYAGIMAPSSMESRYLWEDIPTGLVPIASFGEWLGVPTPATKAIIALGSLIHQTDYYMTGRTVEKLGVAGLTLDELHQMVLFNRYIIHPHPGKNGHPDYGTWEAAT